MSQPCTVKLSPLRWTAPFKMAATRRLSSLATPMTSALTRPWETANRMLGPRMEGREPKGGGRVGLWQVEPTGSETRGNLSREMKLLSCLRSSHWIPKTTCGTEQNRTVQDRTEQNYYCWLLLACHSKNSTGMIKLIMVELIPFSCFSLSVQTCALPTMFFKCAVITALYM